LESYESFIEKMKTNESNFEKSSMSPSKIQESSIFHNFPKKSSYFPPKESNYDMDDSEDLLDQVSLMKNESASLINFSLSNLIFFGVKKLKKTKDLKEKKICNQTQNNSEEHKKTDTIYQNHKQEPKTMISPENTPENINGEIELVLQPVEGSQTNFYRFDSKGGKIGRHSSNEMVILDESISRHHAEIMFADDRCFYLKDSGSTTGTFIKISEVILKEKMIIEMGSNQFSIEKIMDKDNIIEILIIEGTEKNNKKSLNFNTNPVVTFGRKMNNTVMMIADNHMSNTHSRIQKDNRNFYILEDLNSTNGFILFYDLIFIYFIEILLSSKNLFMIF